MEYFDSLVYQGLASTTYILDASACNATTLNSLTTKTGGGDVTLASPLTGAGGAITLATTSSGDTATVKMPITFGNILGSVVGWRVELIGVASTTSRTSLTLSAKASPTNLQAITWDSSGISGSTTYSGESSTQMIKSGAFNTLVAADMGFQVDYRSQQLRNYTAHVGGSRVNIVSPLLGGTYTPEVALVGSGINSVSFRQFKVQVFWGTRGDAISKVY